MDKANAAEWILRRFVGSSRAAELVGDRLESHPADGSLRFWGSIVWLVVVFCWPTLIGFVLAVVGGTLFSVYPFAVVVTKRAVHESRGDGSWVYEAAYYMFFGMLLWAAATFSLVRFGFRSELSRVGLAAALLCTAAECLWWAPHVPMALLAIAVAVALFYLSSSERRRALGVLSVVIALGWLTSRLLVHIPRGSHLFFFRDSQILSALGLVPLVEVAASLFLHKRLLAED